ncbi:MAG TPA: hypothetical protein VKU40_06585, partial [Thermoanaerobaculia bacterium]|nr:hypothetical protein [Thermoanaerobaculia bacterium]
MAETATGVRDRHLEELAASLRGRLVERRRAGAAAGIAPVPVLEREVLELVDGDAALLAAADRE